MLLVLNDDPADFEIGGDLHKVDGTSGRTSRGLDQRSHLIEERHNRTRLRYFRFGFHRNIASARIAFNELRGFSFRRVRLL